MQFHIQDNHLFKQVNVLPHATPLEQLQQSDSVHLYLDNQKNWKQGSTMYRDAINNALFPIKYISNCIHYLY